MLGAAAPGGGLIDPAAALPRFAYVGLDRQVHVAQPDGGERRQVTYAQVESPLMRWGGSSGGDACAWPTFSPQGDFMACFRSTVVEGQSTPSDIRVAVLQVDGPEEVELDRIDEGLPLYARWSPDGQALAVLVQADDQLELRVCTRDQVGRHRVVDEGPPLFFGWLPDSRRLVLHAGGPSGSRLTVRDPLGSGEDVPLPGVPGTFCAPIVVGDRVVYAIQRGERSVVISAHPDGGDPVELFEAEGLLAFVPSPDGRWLAVSHAALDRGPYVGVSRVPLDGSGPAEQVAPEPCMAFFWLPGSDGLLTVGLDEARKCLWWNLHLVESGDRRTIGPFRPTRELMFHLHFFEQFAGSHPLVSPDGRFLVYPSFEGALAGPDAPPGRPRIEVVELGRPEMPAVAVAHGRYATFAPATTRG